MALIFSSSADRHGIARQDAINAILNYRYRVQKLDEPRLGSKGRPDLFIGPARDNIRLLEVMAVLSAPDEIFVFHVMEVRAKILKIAQERRQPQ